MIHPGLKGLETASFQSVTMTSPPQMDGFPKPLPSIPGILSPFHCKVDGQDAATVNRVITVTRQLLEAYGAVVEFDKVKFKFIADLTTSAQACRISVQMYMGSENDVIVDIIRLRGCRFMSCALYKQLLISLASNSVDCTSLISLEKPVLSFCPQPL
jgi:hypothetical protein